MENNHKCAHDSSDICTFNTESHDLSTHCNAKLTVHVVQHLAPGGIETLVLEMLRLANERHRVLVISLEGNLPRAIQQWPKLASFKGNLIFLNKPSGFHFSAIIRLARLLKFLKPDVLHTHHIGPLLYGGAACKLTSVPCHIHTEHDIWHLSNRNNERLQRMALAIAKPRLVADAEMVSSQLSRRFKYADITVIKNGIDCRRFKPASQSLARQQFGLPLSGTIIGCAGRLEHVKGQDVLIKALAMLPSNFSVAIAGDGSQSDSLKKLAKHLNVSNRIHWLGLVDDMPRFYQSLDLFCLPSRHEGFPLSTLEAQSCDIVTVASHVGAVEETICPCSGQLFQAEQPHALTAKIYSALAQMKPLSPRQFVLKNNDIESMVAAYQRLSMEVR
ncbi:putative glycosyl transferase [Vibrio ichthyoenteri ATCC 700023]|uniref:Putative glycosyl transferase n=1 Tax=Vibrio ichthyoenteri ATCC 700023 TaxID=870968 RepID=F9S0J3_9VIBR|nr:glycosyltransferase [Vibrio ichthyoenteri]EGU43280.1 putative glycosyl transferase [Vibrio ichthyoenteri ATCC 700023]